MIIYKKNLIYILLLSLILCPKLVRSNPTDITAIKNVLMGQQSAWNNGNIDAYMDGYLKSEKLRFASGNSYKFGWKKTLQGYKKKYPDKATMGHLTFTIHDIDLLSTDTALVFGAWHLKRKKDEPNGLYTLLFKKTKQGWKIVADHTSSGND